MEKIKWDWNCIKSIKKAEKRKQALENSGYRLVRSTGDSLTYSKL